MSQYRIAVLPGDGIGPEVTRASMAILKEACRLFGIRLESQELLVGGLAIESCGEALPGPTLAAARRMDAVLLGSLGTSHWDDLPVHMRPEQAMFGLRRALGLYANLYPCRIDGPLRELSPLRSEVLQQPVDFLLIRDLLGLRSYKRSKTENETGPSVDVLVSTEAQVRQLAFRAFELARTRKRRLAAVDRSNTFESSTIWRKVIREVSGRYPDVEVSYYYTENMVSQLILDPTQFDLILADNINGDFYAEEISALYGSPALACVASLGRVGTTGLFGGLHGSAEHLAGRNICNPLGCILGGALMMRWGLGERRVAELIEEAVMATLKQGYRTQDLLRGYTANEGVQLVSTTAMTQAVLKNINALKSSIQEKA